MHIKSKQTIVGVNLVKPSDIFAKLFAAIPVKIPKDKIIYPMYGFIINLLKLSYLLKVSLWAPL